jgi:hypothetical protein
VGCHCRAGASARADMTSIAFGVSPRVRADTHAQHRVKWMAAAAAAGATASQNCAKRTTHDKQMFQAIVIVNRAGAEHVHGKETFKQATSAWTTSPLARRA